MAAGEGGVGVERINGVKRTASLNNDRMDEYGVSAQAEVKMGC